MNATEEEDVGIAHVVGPGKCQSRQIGVSSRIPRFGQRA